MKRVIDRRVAAAQVNARVRRADILATIAELRHRLDPRVMAAETATDVMSQVTRAIDDAGTAARARPWLLAGVATLIGVGVAARARLKSESDEPLTDEATNADV